MKEETKRLLTACFLTLFIVIFIFAQRGLLKETNIVKWDFTLRSLFNNKATIFLLKNRIDIILVVLMIILISVIFTTREFKPNKLQPKVQNTVVIEGLTTDICDDELQKLRPIYEDEIDIGMGSYNNNMDELRQQINDGKNITLTEDEIRDKINGLKTNNLELQRNVYNYIASRKRNCEMDTDNDGMITESFTNMFSKNTFKEALQTLKKDQKLLENMDNQYNKTNSDIETDLIKNEYRTGAYALGIVIVGVLIISRFQNK